jgi:hypothetical protein
MLQHKDKVKINYLEDCPLTYDKLCLCRQITVNGVTKPKLFVLALALTFKKYLLWLQLVGILPVDTTFNWKSRVFMIFGKNTNYSY